MKTFSAIALSMFALCLAWAAPASGNLLYSNNFDGGEQAGAGITSGISGGTSTTGGVAGGTTDSQGFDSYAHFGGDFWRLTTANDVLEFTFSGIPTHDTVSVCFSLAMIDSWDGPNLTYGVDRVNFAILDGGTQIGGFSEIYSGGNAPSTGVDSIVVQNTQLGFNTNQRHWMEDGYRMCFENLTHTSGTLTLQFWADGNGFQGGNDESFAIDNLVVTYAVPEPNLIVVAGGLIMFWTRRKRS